MSTQLGAPVRIVALIGLLSALAMGAWTFVIGRNGATTSSTTSTPSLSSSPDSAAVARNPVAAAHAVAGKLSAHNRATAAGKPDVVAPPSPSHATVMPAHKPAHVAKPKPTSSDGTPTTIASMLRRHHVVVVLLYDPQSSIDTYSVGEAQVGAADAKAGFLRLNVLHARPTMPFAKAYGVIQTPTLLFFAHGGKLVQKLTGFADRESVTQAAVNAARGIAVPQG